MPNHQKSISDGQTNEVSIYLQPIAEHKFTIIMLHGLGDSAHGFFDWVNEAGALFSDDNEFGELLKHCRIVIPCAPSNQPVTCNNGQKMNSWFDFLSFDDIKDQSSEAMIQMCICQEDL